MPDVRAAAQSREEEATELSRGRPMRLNIRIRPDQQEQLRQAKFDIQAAFREETTETQILEAFIGEEFPGWVQRKLKGDGKK